MRANIERPTFRPISSSVILREEHTESEAAFFFSHFNLSEIDKARPKLNCTGEAFFRDRPDIYKAVVRSLTEPGVTVRMICRELHVTDDTVRSVKAFENLNITNGLRVANARPIQPLPDTLLRDAVTHSRDYATEMKRRAERWQDIISAKVDASAKIDKIIEEFNRMKHAEVIEVEPEPINCAESMHAAAIATHKKRTMPCNTGLSGENAEQKALTEGVKPEPEIETMRSEPAVLQEAAT